MRCGGFFDIERKKMELAELREKIENPSFWNNNPSEVQSVTKRLSELNSAIELYESIKRQYEDIKILYNLMDSEEDKRTYFDEIISDLEKLKKEITNVELGIKFSDPLDKNNAIVSLHAGAGGTEACDWCEILLRMYKRWAESKKYTTEIVDILPGEEAGIKSVTFLVRGEYAYGHLKCEVGVHRLVRISPFDANKRRHTSFASCDVIPEVEEDINIEIKEEDIRIDTYRASGHGGQHVNKTDSAVRITHIPTGIVVQCQNERSQYKNKVTALKILKSRLYQLELQKRKEMLEKQHKEKTSIGWGHQIRSYIFMPYRLVKDHRTGVETTDVTSVLNGDIDIFIEKYLEKVSLSNKDKEQKRGNGEKNG